MKSRLLLLLACIILLSPLIGCKDIAGTLKARFNKATQSTSATSAGNFGNTSEEQAMINAVTEKYGDLREQGSPRIIELMLCSSVVNYIPADRVSQYSSNTPKFYAWFIYDNFNEDTISVEWLYLNDNYSIGTSKSKTGKDFGRGSFTLEAPDDGWPLGKYRVKVSGKGVAEQVDFHVISGSTVSVAILQPNGSVDLSGLEAAAAGTEGTATGTGTSPSGTGAAPSDGGGAWHLKDVKYTPPSIDGKPQLQRLMGGTCPGGCWYYTQTGSGSSGNLQVDIVEENYERTKVTRSNTIEWKWSHPPEYIRSGERPSLSFEQTAVNEHRTGQISFPQFNSGLGFRTADDKTYAPFTFRGMVTLNKGMPTGRKGETMSMHIIRLQGFTYKFTYTYEWLEGASTTGTTSSPTTTPPPSPTTIPPAAAPAKPTTPSIKPGWYFTSWEYVPSSSDYELVGIINRGGNLFDTSVGEGEKNDFTVSLSRKDAKGNVIASGSCKFIWADPPEFLAANQKASFTLNRHGESFWGIGQTMASFDMEDINPGYTTAGKIEFVISNGKTYFSGNYEGILETAKVLPKGSKPGDMKAIIINLSNGYGYKYYYEWRE